MKADPTPLPIRNPEDLGRQIRAARKAQGLTQTELAETAGVGTRFVSELERGKETARLGLSLEIARLVGIDILARPRGPSKP
jgi:y4mF family transcriptional regulator